MYIYQILPFDQPDIKGMAQFIAQKPERFYITVILPVIFHHLAGKIEIDHIRACLLYTSTGWLTSILHRMGVVLMDKKPFDFKDLMAFGMFILALLTFVFAFIR